jgi:hypothetical protein
MMLLSLTAGLLPPIGPSMLLVCEDLMTKYLLFTEKCVVLKYSFIFIVLGLDTSSQSSMDGPIGEQDATRDV